MTVARASVQLLLLTCCNWVLGRCIVDDEGVQLTLQSLIVGSALQTMIRSALH